MSKHGSSKSLTIYMTVKINIYIYIYIKYAEDLNDRCSASLIIKEMQINTTMKYYLIPVRMATIKKSTNNKC